MDNNISVQLGSQFENFISSEIATGKYDSASKVIIAGLILLKLEEFKTKEILNELGLGEQSSTSENFPQRTTCRVCEKSISHQMGVNKILISMHYYRLLDDLNIEGRWFLGEVDLDDEFGFWQYVKAGEVQDAPSELAINFRQKGNHLDFTMADFELLVINERVASLFNKDEVQLIPLTIKGFKSSDNYYLMMIKNELDCVDNQKSDYTLWEEGNDIRPDRVGEYESFFKLVINPDLIHDHNVFRIKNYDLAIIVSETIKKAFEKNLIRGVQFRLVS